MAEQNRGGRGRRGRGGRGRGVVLEADEQPRLRNLRDVEIEEQRRRIQDLERQLARARLGVQSDEGVESEDPSDDEEEDVNPFRVLNQGRNREVRPGDQSSFRQIGMKIEIPEFEGKTHPDEFIDWLHTVERVFDIKDDPVYDESDGEQEDADPDIIYADSGESLVIRKILNVAVEKEKENPLDFVEELQQESHGEFSKCFKCYGYGHLQEECPNHKAITIEEIEKINLELQVAKQDSDHNDFEFEKHNGVVLQAQQDPHNKEPKSKEQNEFIEPVEEGDMLAIQVSTSNYTTTDGKTLKSCFEAKAEVIDEKGMIMVAKDIACHFHFVFPEELSPKVAIKCQNIFDIFSTSQHALNILVCIKLMHYLVRWRGRPGVLSESSFIGKNGCGKFCTSNLGDEATTRFEDKSFPNLERMMQSDDGELANSEADLPN